MLIKFSKQIGNSLAKIINTKVNSKIPGHIPDERFPDGLFPDGQLPDRHFPDQTHPRRTLPRPDTSLTDFSRPDKCPTNA